MLSQTDIEFELGSLVVSSYDLSTLVLFILSIHCLRPLEIDKMVAKYFKFRSYGVEDFTYWACLQVLRQSRNRWVGACNSHTKPMSQLFTDWSIFSITFLLWKKDSSGPVTQWRQLLSCYWSWRSHGSLIPGKFDLKINRSMKTSWQECSEVACSYSSAPGQSNLDDTDLKTNTISTQHTNIKLFLLYIYIKLPFDATQPFLNEREAARTHVLIPHYC